MSFKSLFLIPALTIVCLVPYAQRGWAGGGGSSLWTCVPSIKTCVESDLPIIFDVVGTAQECRVKEHQCQYWETNYYWHVCTSNGAGVEYVLEELQAAYTPNAVIVGDALDSEIKAFLQENESPMGPELVDFLCAGNAANPGSGTCDPMGKGVSSENCIQPDSSCAISLQICRPAVSPAEGHAWTACEPYTKDELGVLSQDNTLTAAQKSAIGDTAKQLPNCNQGDPKPAEGETPCSPEPPMSFIACDPKITSYHSCGMNLHEGEYELCFQECADLNNDSTYQWTETYDMNFAEAKAFVDKKQASNDPLEIADGKYVESRLSEFDECPEPPINDGPNCSYEWWIQYCQMIEAQVGEGMNCTESAKGLLSNGFDAAALYDEFRVLDACVDQTSLGVWIKKLGEDTDGDLIADFCDNCRKQDNTDQLDQDKDAVGNVCDNCVVTPNPRSYSLTAVDQASLDCLIKLAIDNKASGQGAKQIAITNLATSLLTNYYGAQADSDGDGKGDECEVPEGTQCGGGCCANVCCCPTCLQQGDSGCEITNDEFFMMQADPKLKEIMDPDGDGRRSALINPKTGEVVPVTHCDSCPDQWNPSLYYKDADNDAVDDACDPCITVDGVKEGDGKCLTPKEEVAAKTEAPAEPEVPETAEVPETEEACKGAKGTWSIDAAGIGSCFGYKAVGSSGCALSGSAVPGYPTFIVMMGFLLSVPYLIIRFRRARATATIRRRSRPL